MTREKFRAKRRKLGLSQPKLALELGLSCSTIRKWEQGLRPIPHRWPELALDQLLFLKDHQEVMRSLNYGDPDIRETPSANT